MFDRATKKLVQQIDPTGALIAASSLNDSKKLQPLAIVLKSQKRWFWQQIKYKPKEFTLNDLLEKEETNIEPVCKREEFVKYRGTYRNKGAGSAEVGGHAATLNVNGLSTSKLCLSLGTLEKEYVDIPKLHKASRGRKLNLKHSLIQQSLKGNKVFTLLVERIFTTSNCAISCTELEKATCHAMFGGCFSKISMEGSGEQQHGSETELDIPPDTVLAYSVIKISIDSDGYFDLCLESDGCEADDIAENPFPIYSEVDGKWPLIQEGSSLDTLKKALEDVETSFCAFAGLSAARRSSILLLLKKILLDQPLLSALVDRLEELISGETSSFLNKELSKKQSQIIGEFLDVLKCESLGNNGLSTSASLSITNECQASAANHSDPLLVSDQNGCAKAVSHQNGCSAKASKPSMELMNAMLMLISALTELTDIGLNLLAPFCTSELLKCLQDLVIHLTTTNMPLLKDTISVFLQSDDEFHKVEKLFKYCSVSLKKENNTLTSEISCKEGFLPVVLCIAIHGLASLSTA